MDTTEIQEILHGILEADVYVLFFLLLITFALFRIGNKIDKLNDTLKKK